MGAFKLLSAGVIVATISHALAAPNPFDKHCAWPNSGTLGKVVPYCVYTPKKKRGRGLVYFLPGDDGRHADFDALGYAAYFSGRAHLLGYSLPTIVTIGLDGEHAYTDTADQDPSTRVETWFFDELLPEIESRVGFKERRSCRALAGFSSGGFGALKLGLRRFDVFGTLAANSALMPARNPHSTDATWNEFFDRYRVDPQKGLNFVDRWRRVFRDQRHFESHDPIFLTLDFPRMQPVFPNIYFDVGGRDEWGSQEPAIRLERALILRKKDFEFDYATSAAHAGRPEQRIKLVDFLLSNLCPDQPSLDEATTLGTANN